VNLSSIFSENGSKKQTSLTPILKIKFFHPRRLIIWLMTVPSVDEKKHRKFRKNKWIKNKTFRRSRGIATGKSTDTRWCRAIWYDRVWSTHYARCRAIFCTNLGSLDKRFAIDCIFLLWRNFSLDKKSLLVAEGTTECDPHTTPVYAVGITPLLYSNASLDGHTNRFC